MKPPGSTSSETSTRPNWPLTRWTLQAILATCLACGSLSAQAMPGEPVHLPHPLPTPHLNEDEPDQSPDDESEGYPRLRFRGQLQLQFDDGARGTAVNDDPFPALNGLGRFNAPDRVALRRGRLVTSLALQRGIELINESNFDTRTNELSVLDLYLRAQLSEQLSMRAGLFKIPFGWEGQRSSRTTNTVEMSDMTRAFSNFRDSGVAFNWHQGDFDITAALVQGQGGVWTDLNPQKDFVVRATYKPISTLQLGGSLYLGSFRTSNGEDIRSQRWGLELQYAEGPWKLEGEYQQSHGYNFFARRDTVADGFYLALVRQLDQRNDLVLHFDRLEPDLLARDLLGVDNGRNTRNRLVLGWNYYFQRNPEHRLMFNYEIVNEEEGQRLNNNGFRIRYQFAW